MKLCENLGFSTLFMQVNSECDTLWHALDAAYDAGLQNVEIVPANNEGLSGWPKTRFSVGIDLDTITPGERNRLVESVSRFRLRNVHSMHRDINIASRNAGIARESMRQYLMCAQLAVDIQAQSATFHPGKPNPTEAVGDEAFVIHQNIEAGKLLAEFAEKHELNMGYENVGLFPTLAQMQEILHGIGSDRFGLHLDIGHVWLSDIKDPLRWIREIESDLMAVHLHGTFHRPDRTFENHMPLELDDCTDFPALIHELTTKAPHRLLVCETIAKDIRSYIGMCIGAKELLRTM